MIGKTALAFTAAVVLASAAALMVWAAGGALYLALTRPIGEAAAAACVAGAAAVFLLVVLLIANVRGNTHHDINRDSAAPHLHGLIDSFSDTIKERPLLTLGLAALTGVAATRDPNLLKDLWAAILRKPDDQSS